MVKKCNLGSVWEFIREWNGIYLSKGNEWKIMEWNGIK